MQRLHWESLSPAWSEFLTALFDDLEPLGHVLTAEDAGGFSALVVDAAATPDSHWGRAHEAHHLAVLEQHRDAILEFERDFDWCFVDMKTFQPSAVRPILRAVDFRNPLHLKILDYLRLSQSVMSGRLVGRRMAFLIFDEGQAGNPRLFGGAVLASARFSQRIRDRRLSWPPDYPRTSDKHDPAARARRVDGLGRIMQLSVACAVPPYNVLSGAWLAALAPFTRQGLDAFRSAMKTPDPNADLAMVVTTTGKGLTGAPFQGHRVCQLTTGVKAAQDAKGDLYAQARRADDIKPLRASFESLVSDQTRALACALFQAERPEHHASLKKPYRSAMAFALRRLGLRRSLFDGNQIGVHLGVLGEATLSALELGRARPANARPLITWDQAVAVWSRKFLPAPELVGDSADRLSMDAHRAAAQEKAARARRVPPGEIRLSSKLAPVLGPVDPD